MAYDARALGTRLRGSLRQPAAERTLANKNKAISFAAYMVPAWTATPPPPSG